MTRNAFQDRERAAEAAYFAKRDAVLIERIRASAKLGDIAHAMAEKLRLDDPALLDRIVKLGVTRDSAAAFLLAPLVEIAWADGDVSKAEQDAIVRFATARGVAPDSADMAQLLQWLKARPPHDLFASALEAIKLGLSVLPPDEAHERVTAMLHTCKEVAQAAGGIERLLSLGGTVSPHERSVLAEIRTRLQASGK
jgi:tellurite resistance protein